MYLLGLLSYLRRYVHYVDQAGYVQRVNVKAKHSELPTKHADSVAYPKPRNFGCTGSFASFCRLQQRIFTSSPLY